MDKNDNILNTFSPDDFSDDGSDPKTDDFEVTDLYFRKGKINISAYAFMEIGYSGLSALFSEFFPLYIANNPLDKNIEYWGVCRYFKPISEGEKSPSYSFIFDGKKGEVYIKKIIGDNGQIVYSNENSNE